jgi:hypothetical protein
MQAGLARCLLFRAPAPEGCVLRPASGINRGVHSVYRLGPRELVSHHKGFAQLASVRRRRLQITRAPAGRSVTLPFSAPFVSAHLFFLPPPHLAHPRLILRASTHASLFLQPPPPPWPPPPPFSCAVPHAVRWPPSVTGLAAPFRRLCLFLLIRILYPARESECAGLRANSVFECARVPASARYSTHGHGLNPRRGPYRG